MSLDIDKRNNEPWTTEEFCAHCEQEVIIPADRLSVCPECGEEILPCSTCCDDLGHRPCNWTKEKGCWRFPK